jgi:hypothetical protein
MSWDTPPGLPTCVSVREERQPLSDMMFTLAIAADLATLAINKMPHQHQTLCTLSS